MVSGDALVDGNAYVDGESRVGQQAHVGGDAELTGKTVVAGDAEVVAGRYDGKVMTGSLEIEQPEPDVAAALAFMNG